MAVSALVRAPLAPGVGTFGAFQIGNAFNDLDPYALQQ